MTTTRVRAALTGAVLALALTVATPAHAAESRIPIAAPTTISASGTYVVTRDIASNGPPTLNIASGDVVIDLNGHTLAQLNSGWINVLVATDAHVTIRNGHVVGGMFGIGPNSQGSPGGALQLHDLEIRDTSSYAVSAATSQVIITGCAISGTGAGLFISANGSDAQVRVTGNTIRAGGMGVALQGDAQGVVRGAVIADNTISAPGSDATVVIGAGAAGTLVRRNTIFAGSVYGIWSLGGGGDVIEGNVVRGGSTYGIYVSSNGARVAGNTVTRAGQNGIEIDGQSSSVESNLSAENGNAGINIAGTGNVHRNNTSRGNGSAAYVVYPGNTDGGGNF